MATDPQQAQAPKAVETNVIGNRSVVPVPFDLDLQNLGLPETRTLHFNCFSRVRGYLSASDESRQFDKELSKSDLTFASDNLAQLVIVGGTKQSALYPLIALSIKYDEDHKEMLKYMAPLIRAAVLEGFIQATHKIEQELPVNNPDTYTKRVYVIDFGLTMDHLEILDKKIRDAEITRDRSLNSFPLADIAPTVEKLKRLSNRAEKKLERGEYKNDDEKKELERKMLALRNQARRGKENIADHSEALEEKVSESKREKRIAINEAINLFKRVRDRGFQDEYDPLGIEPAAITDSEKSKDKRIWDQVVSDISEAVREGFVGTHSKELSVDRFMTEFSALVKNRRK